MKLMIAGRPKSGKSTIFSELVAGVSPRRGFITKEFVNDHHRIGFVVEDMNSQGAAGLNFCYGRSSFNRGAVIASSHRVAPSTFVGLALHEGGHSMGLVDPLA